MGLPSARLFFTGIFVTFGGSFHFGYQLSVVNPTEELFESFFNSSYCSHYGTYLTENGLRLLWSTVTGALFIGALFGASLIPWLAQRFGRRNSLFLSSTLFILSCIPSALAYHFHSFESFIVGRIAFGIATGLATGFQGLYLTEISPVQYRGFMGALTGLMVEGGFLLGSILALPTVLGTENLWPLLYWLETVPSAILLVVLGFSYESPSYLVGKGHEERAKKSVQIYHQIDSGQINDYIQALQKELEVEQNSTSLLGLFKVKLARKGAILGVLVGFAVSFCGVTAMSFFSTYLMSEVGFTHLGAAYANVAVTGAGFLAACVSPFATEKIGRRPLFLFACIVLTILNCVMLTLLLLYEYIGSEIFGYFFMAANGLFMLTFGTGMAPIIWFLSTELVPQNCKAPAQGLSIMVQYFTGFLAPIIFLPLEGAVGAYSFLLFIVPMVVLTIYFYAKLPETKNMSTVDVLTKLYGRLHDISSSQLSKNTVEDNKY